MSAIDGARPRRAAVVVFTLASLGYVVAILQRTSLGVAGIAAADRFNVGASALSSMAVLQLIVYAGMQIPVGILLDKHGPRFLLLIGAILMAIGQFAMAFAPTLTWGIIARILVGAGDAMTFVSGIRLINSWFRGERVPILVQWFGNLGQLGQILSAGLIAPALTAIGWTPTFGLAAVCSLVVFSVTLLFLADAPVPRKGPAPTFLSAVRSLAPAVRRPGTRLGFWSHFVTQSLGTTFTLMWGIPFLERALGLPAILASGMLIIFTLAGVVVGPVIGILTGRFPFRRSNIVIGIVIGILGMWALMLAWPGSPPLWLVILVVVSLGIGGPGSQIGFDFARTFNPRHNLGVATGFVNVGGFLASFTMILIIGMLLDAAGGGHAHYTMQEFRIAFLTPFVIVGGGLIMLMWSRSRVRRRFIEEDGIQVGPLWVAIVRRMTPRRDH